MATTNAAAGAGKQVLTFPPRGLEIDGNVTASKFFNEGKTQFHQFHLFMEALAAALEADLTQLMIDNGLDGQTTVFGISFGSSARRAAKKAVKPLRSIAAEADNIARSWEVADHQAKAHVFDIIQQVMEARERQKNGAGLKMGA